MITRLIAYIVYCAACVLLVFFLFQAMPEIERNYTDRYTTYQQQETARVQAQEATARVQAEQWNETLRTWAWPTAAGVILVVVAVQAGRTLRHRETERTRRRALLAWYAGHYLPDAHVEILPWHGELAIVNHSDGEIIPYSVARLEAPARLLPD